ncbi:hypothetical protein PCE1_001074 [Barthelona sp. PCE]
MDVTCRANQPKSYSKMFKQSSCFCHKLAIYNDSKVVLPEEEPFIFSHDTSIREVSVLEGVNFESICVSPSGMMLACKSANSDVVVFVETISMQICMEWSIPIEVGKLLFLSPSILLFYTQTSIGCLELSTKQTRMFDDDHFYGRRIICVIRMGSDFVVQYERSAIEVFRYRSSLSLESIYSYTIQLEILAIASESDSLFRVYTNDCVFSYTDDGVMSSETIFAYPDGIVGLEPIIQYTDSQSLIFVNHLCGAVPVRINGITKQILKSIMYGRFVYQLRESKGIRSLHCFLFTTEHLGKHVDLLHNLNGAAYFLEKKLLVAYTNTQTLVGTVKKRRCSDMVSVPSVFKRVSQMRFNLQGFVMWNSTEIAYISRNTMYIFSFERLSSSLIFVKPSKTTCQSQPHFGKGFLSTLQTFPECKLCFESGFFRSFVSEGDLGIIFMSKDTFAIHMPLLKFKRLFGKDWFIQDACVCRDDSDIFVRYTHTNFERMVSAQDGYRSIALIKATPLEFASADSAVSNSEKFLSFLSECSQIPIAFGALPSACSMLSMTLGYGFAMIKNAQWCRKQITLLTHRMHVIMEKVARMLQKEPALAEDRTIEQILISFDICFSEVFEFIHTIGFKSDSVGFTLKSNIIIRKIQQFDRRMLEIYESFESASFATSSSFEYLSTELLQRLVEDELPQLRSSLFQITSKLENLSIIPNLIRPSDPLLPEHFNRCKAMSVPDLVFHEKRGVFYYYLSGMRVFVTSEFDSLAVFTEEHDYMRHIPSLKCSSLLHVEQIGVCFSMANITQRLSEMSLTLCSHASRLQFCIDVGHAINDIAKCRIVTNLSPLHFSLVDGKFFLNTSTFFESEGFITASKYNGQALYVFVCLIAYILLEIPCSNFNSCSPIFFSDIEPLSSMLNSVLAHDFAHSMMDIIEGVQSLVRNNSLLWVRNNIKTIVTSEGEQVFEKSKPYYGVDICYGSEIMCFSHSEMTPALYDRIYCLHSAMMPENACNVLKPLEIRDVSKGAVFYQRMMQLEKSRLFPRSIRIGILVTVAETLQKMHYNGIYHGFLHPSSIFLNESFSPHICFFRSTIRRFLPGLLEGWYDFTSWDGAKERDYFDFALLCHYLLYAKCDTTKTKEVVNYLQRRGRNAGLKPVIDDLFWSILQGKEDRWEYIIYSLRQLRSCISNSRSIEKHSAPTIIGSVCSYPFDDDRYQRMEGLCRKAGRFGN